MITEYSEEFKESMLQKINLCIWQGLQQLHGSGLEKADDFFFFAKIV